MKQIWKELILALFLGMILPALVLNTVLSMEGTESPEVQTERTDPAGTAVETDITDGAEPMTVLFRDEDGTVTEMDMDTYLVGVLLAEMPASFAPEAKKAQAVAARTYALKASVTGGKHGDGSVCGDYACCQAYRSPEAYLGSGGTREAVDQAREAAVSTSGRVLTYEGQLIEATYFSCSGGSTEDAVAVWGADFPYLRAISSPGEENAAHYTDTVRFTPEEFEAALGVSLPADPEEWFGFTTYTSGGGVNTMRIGNKDYPGTELRSLLGLRSTAFSVTVADGQIEITTRGFGHRVGMSQYGAEAMAVSGSSYQDILAYYYSGTELTLWHPEN